MALFQPLAHSFSRKMAPCGIRKLGETNAKTPVQAPAEEKRPWAPLKVLSPVIGALQKPRQTLFSSLPRPYPYPAIS